MNTTQPLNPGGAWLLYDGECPICCRWIDRLRRPLAKHHFQFAPQQSDFGRATLGLKPGEVLPEMKVLLADGGLLGGIDAALYVARFIWWARAFLLLAKVPGGRLLLGHLYRWFAANRYCFSGRCELPARGRSLTVFEIVAAGLLPIGIAFATWDLPPWMFMWSVALALGIAGKYLTLRDAIIVGRKPAPVRVIIWFFGWPGLDDRTFFDRARSAKPRSGEWLTALIKLTLGVALFFFVAPKVIERKPLLGGWTAMLGIIFTLHFGLFHLLSVIWRTVGLNASPIMRLPIVAQSLTEFWGERWNTAFSIPARRLLLRPLGKKYSVRLASFVIFVFSGLLHEIVISVPARGGYGLPTMYFTLQGLGMLFQESPFGRMFRKGAMGWLFTMCITVAPLYWLFPPVFVRNVIIPMVNTLTHHL